MYRYTATLFDTENQWFFEASVEADDIDEAYRIARRDYCDKRVKLRGVHRD